MAHTRTLQCALALLAGCIIGYNYPNPGNRAVRALLPDEPGEALRWYAERHAGREGGYIPTEHVMKERIKIRQGLYGGLGKSRTVSWVELGPDNIGGRTRALLIDPSSSTTLYAASVGGGVWKSGVGGASWTNTTDALGNIAFTCLAMAPGGDVSTRTIYGGTGEGYYNADAIRGAGLFRTTNSGASWSQVATGAAMSYYINKVVVDPNDANYVYVATNSGLFRSTNGGTSFATIGGFATRVQDLALHPTATDTLYVAVNSSGVYKSANIKAATPAFSLVRSNTNQQRIEIALSDLKPSVLYAVFTNSSGQPIFIERSGDGGVTWVTGTIPTNSDPVLTSYMNGQGWYDNTLGVNPADELTIYVGGVDTYKSSNGGSTWSMMTSWRNYLTPYVHADHHDIVFLNGSTFYLVNDGGVFRTTDAGVTWSDVNAGYNVTQFYYGALSASGSMFIAGAQDNGTLLSTGSSSWSTINGGDGGASLISHTNSNYCYASYVRGYFYRSTNGGASFTSVNPPSAGTTAYEFIAPAEMSQSNSSTLFIAGTSVYRSTANGSSWTSIYTIPSSRRCTAIGLSVTADTIMIGTSGPAVYRTTNAGTAWAAVTPSGLAGTVTDAEVCFSNPNVAYVTVSGYGTGGHVYRTTNLGSASPTWTDISGSLPALPCMCVVTNRANADHLLVGTDAGVFESTDGGASWSAANTGLAGAVSVEDLDTRYDGSVMASTHGRGAFFSGGPLPVELAAFTLARVRNGTLLQWRTATESNNLGFDVQRRDGAEWRSIGFVPGAGTSSAPRTYAHFDASPALPGTTYRLKQLDRDGKISYSPERAIAAAPEVPNAIDLRLYPAPARAGAIVNVCFNAAEPAAAMLVVLDAVGRRMAAHTVPTGLAGTALFALPTAGLAPGRYTVVLTQRSGVQTAPLIITAR